MGKKSKNDNELAANPPKKNNFEILRNNFKTKREYKTLYTTEKEVDNKKESTNIMIRSLRRARNFKNYLDPNKQDVPMPERRFIDDNISRLRTNTGFTNKETEESGNMSEERDQIENNRKNIEAPTSTKRGINTLATFAQGNKNKQPGNMPESKNVSSELDSNDEQIILPSLSPSEYKNNDIKNKIQNVLTGRSHFESKVEPFGECTTRLNLKKPPLATTKQEFYSMKGSIHSRIYSGKKEGLRLDISGNGNDEIAVDSNFTMKYDSVNYTPTSSALHSPAKTSHMATACGHNCSSETTGPLNDESRSVYESQAQMKKIPPLIDNSGDEENGIVIQDRYQTIDSLNVCSSLSSSTEDSDTIPKSEEKVTTYRSPGSAAYRSERIHQDSVRAHTEKSASFLRNSRSRKGLPFLSKSSSFNSSGRFTVLKARVRVRKAEC